MKRTERDLRERDASHLPEELREEREKRLDDLREYWQNGEFPLNVDREERTPIFKNDRDVPRAMAYLVEQSGHEDLFEHIAETDNYVDIDDVEEGPLVEWIEGSGLTKEEAALVRPTYCGPYWPDYL
ncbi:hypothetical protein BRC83_10685 [Halobacteriales archaeon QS_1_68_17]|nr:MAG: hypothetical protein BRC83_10685 [Halobacteriales archaeon QS_1_68_17]